MSPAENRIAPCKSCPYRRSVPVGVWAPEEYANLLRQDADAMGGRTFACHLTGSRPPAERTLCLGWLADQKRRGLPSIQLRILLMRDAAAAAQYARVDETAPDLYGSIAEMCAANEGAIFPEGSQLARGLRRKLATERGGMQ